MFIHTSLHAEIVKRLSDEKEALRQRAEVAEARLAPFIARTKGDRGRFVSSKGSVGA